MNNVPHEIANPMTLEEAIEVACDGEHHDYSIVAEIDKQRLDAELAALRKRVEELEGVCRDMIGACDAALTVIHPMQCASTRGEIRNAMTRAQAKLSTTTPQGEQG